VGRASVTFETMFTEGSWGNHEFIQGSASDDDDVTEALLEQVLIGPLVGDWVNG